MMTLNIDDFCTINSGLLRFSRAQASRFAKEVAGDFNPIHDINGKRFCVPGDLLFAILLSRYGLGESTRVEFSGMVADGVSIDLPDSIDQRYVMIDQRDKEYLTIDVTGDRIVEPAIVQTVIREYGQFSGKTFPDILVQLMQQENVMINPDRPLVIYKSMAIEFEKDPDPGMTLQYDGASFSVDGKKGEAVLAFSLQSKGQRIGAGEKVMLLSGLREYDQAVMDEVVATYAGWKSSYQPVDT